MIRMRMLITFNNVEILFHSDHVKVKIEGAKRKDEWSKGRDEREKNGLVPTGRVEEVLRGTKRNEIYQSRNNKLGKAEEPLRVVKFRAETQDVSYHDSWCGPSR